MNNIIFVTYYYSLSLGKIFLKKVMLPMLKLDTNYGFHELILKQKQSMNIWLTFLLPVIHYRVYVVILLLSMFKRSIYALHEFMWSFYFCRCLRDLYITGVYVVILLLSMFKRSMHNTSLCGHFTSVDV